MLSVLQLLIKFGSLVCPEGLSVVDGAQPWWAGAIVPGAQKKKKQKPPGRKPSHKIWDDVVGDWVDDPNDPPPAKKPVGK